MKNPVLLTAVLLGSALALSGCAAGVPQVSSDTACKKVASFAADTVNDLDDINPGRSADLKKMEKLFRDYQSRVDRISQSVKDKDPLLSSLIGKIAAADSKVADQAKAAAGGDDAAISKLSDELNNAISAIKEVTSSCQS